MIESTNTPVGVKKIDNLSEIERNVYISAVYLVTNTKAHELTISLPSDPKFKINIDPLGQDDWYTSEELKRIYEDHTGKEIDANTLYEVIKDLTNIQIDFSKSNYLNQIGDPELIRLKEKKEIALSLGDYYPIVRLFCFHKFQVARSNNDKVEYFGFSLIPESKRAISAIFDKDKDVSFWKLIYDNQEKVDLKFKEFLDYQNQQESLQNKLTAF